MGWELRIFLCAVLLLVLPPSRNLPVCVSTTDLPGQCSVHVTLNRAGAVNTDPQSPSDYQGAALAWIDARLADA